MPVFSRSAISSPRSIEPVWMAATSPYSVAFAVRTASSTSFTTTTGATGPKISSRMAAMDGVTPASTVGR